LAQPRAVLKAQLLARRAAKMKAVFT